MSKEDPDELDTYIYSEWNKESVPSCIMVLRDQLNDEIDRLKYLLDGALRYLADDQYLKGCHKIGIKDKDDERSEFSKRLASARALFKALEALETLEGRSARAPRSRKE